MPTEFIIENTPKNAPHTTRDCGGLGTILRMAYDGSGRRISKTRLCKVDDNAWETAQVTHYTGVGTEVRENFHNGILDETKVVVNMPQGLGRYQPEDAANAFASATLDENGKPFDATSALSSAILDKNGCSSGECHPGLRAGIQSGFVYEFYLKNHLGSTMLVYGSLAYADGASGYTSGVKAAYDYRAFDEQIGLTNAVDKVTENFTGKEKDDETDLNYFGARYLDPMLGLWISVDPARQFASPYLYAGNGYNPINAIDPDGNIVNGSFNKTTGTLTLTDNETGKTVSGQYFSGGKPIGEPIPNGRYEIPAQARKPGFYRLDMIDGNPRNDVAELPDGSTRDRLRLHGQGNSTGCITACEGTNHSEIVDLLQNTETTTVKDNYDAPFYVDVKNWLFGKDSDTDITKYGELDVTD